jgi:hypothetical protein
MFRLQISWCFFIFLGLAANIDAEELNLPQGSVCWPLHFSGITLGITTDPQVQRLLGKGIFRSSEGDAGGRYYIDKNSKATLHVVSYTDSIVGEVTIVKGISPEIKATEQKTAVSPWFSPNEGFGNWHALSLGSSKEDVLKNLGKPEREISANEWMYSSTCACELPHFFTLSFKNGRLFKIVLSAPAG